jgi:protease I
MARIVMPVGEGYEDSEFQVPFDRLRERGDTVVVVGLEQGRTVHGKRGKSAVEVEATADQLYPDDFDAMVIPGGHGPDRLRMDQALVDFVRGFVATGKPVAAICHGPQLLIEAGQVSGRTLTSWPSVRRDLINAGASWVDEEVVVDGNLITSRKPGDLDAFVAALLERL